MENEFWLWNGDGGTKVKPYGDDNRHQCFGDMSTSELQHLCTHLAGSQAFGWAAEVASKVLQRRTEKSVKLICQSTTEVTLPV